MMETICNVFIISSEWQDLGDRHILRYYGVSENRQVVEIVIDTQQPVFFVPRSSKLPPLPFPFQQKTVQLQNFDRAPVNALYFRTQKEAKLAHQMLSAAGIRTFEADIRSDRRFLMERFIYAQVTVRGKAQHSGGLLSFKNPRLTPCQITPELRIASIDIETGVASGRLYSIAMQAQMSGQNNDQRWVFMVSGPPEDAPDYLHCLPGEPEVLQAFISTFQTVDPDIIIGWNVIGFDLDFLDKKCREHGIAFRISRSGRPIRIRKRRKSGLMTVDISGRAVLDGPQLVRSVVSGLVDYSLETASQEILGRGKKIASDVDKIREIEDLYQNEPLKLAQYNLEDCILVTDIFQKLGLIDLQVRRSQISGLLLKDVGISTAEFDHIYLPRLHRMGFVAPNAEDIRQFEHTAGGYVMEPVIGIHDHVVLLDFKSLYPSIIQTFKIEPIARILADIDPLTTPTGYRFSRTQNCLPDVITELMQRRAAAKAAGDEPLSHAIKILMNSFYGIMGSDVSRFYHQDLPTAVTGTARWLLEGCQQYLESRGYRVLYGDTDSVFVKIPPESAKTAFQTGEKLAADLNAYWQQRIREMGLKSYMEIEFEKYYGKFVLPLARGKQGGARKRYAGLRITKNVEKLEFVGMEYVRTDWSPLAKDFQYGLYWRALKGLPLAGWIQNYLHELWQGKKDPLLVYHKRLRKPVEEYTRNAPPQVQAARILIEGGYSSEVRNVRYLITRRGPMPVETHPADIDYLHYIQKQLQPIANSLLQLMNTSFSELIRDTQLSFLNQLEA